MFLNDSSKKVHHHSHHLVGNFAEWAAAEAGCFAVQVVAADNFAVVERCFAHYACPLNQ